MLSQNETSNFGGGPDTLDMYVRETMTIQDISAGGRHSLVLMEDGSLFSFGFGTNGQLGLRSTANKSRPQHVKDLAGRRVTQIAAGWNHSLVMTEGGDLWACGYGAHGQLGLGDKESKTQFSLVTSMSNKNISKIFAGGSHSWLVLNHIQPVREPPREIPSTLTKPIVSFSHTPDHNTPVRNNRVGQTSMPDLGASYYQRPKTSPFQNKTNQMATQPMQKQAKDQPQDDFIQKVLEV